MSEANSSERTRKLTKTVVEALPSPAAGQVRYFDSELDGFGVTVLVIRRGDDVIAIPNGDSSIEAEDLLVLLTTGPIPSEVRPVVGISSQISESGWYYK